MAVGERLDQLGQERREFTRGSFFVYLDEVSEGEREGNDGDN